MKGNPVTNHLDKILVHIAKIDTRDRIRGTYYNEQK